MKRLRSFLKKLFSVRVSPEPGGLDNPKDLNDEPSSIQPGNVDNGKERKR